MYRDSSEWEEYLGEQLRNLRLRLNLRQDELASRAKVSSVTISRLESGKGSSLSTLIKVLQVLRREDWLEQLAPKASVSPIQIHALGKPRQRARKSTAQNSTHGEGSRRGL
jgi:transcriptional regulator with XRE-family HTH domain